MVGRPRASFLRNTGVVAFGQVFGIVAAMVVSILMARYLGPDGKGQVALALGISLILGQILSLGFDIASPYFTASGKLEPQQELGACIMTFLLGTGLALGIIYPLCFRYLMSNVFSGVDKKLLLFAALGCPLYMMRILINGLMAGYEEFARQTYHNCATHLTTVAAVVLALVVFHLGPIAYVQLYIALGSCAAIYGLILLNRIMRLTPEFSLSAWLKGHICCQLFLGNVFGGDLHSCRCTGNDIRGLDQQHQLCALAEDRSFQP